MKNYTIRKIITPVVLSKNNGSVTAWSAHLSNLFKAQLVLYNAVPANSADDELYPSIHGNKINQLFKTATLRLRALGASLKNAYSLKYLVESGTDWHNLTRQARDEYADLLVAEMPAEGATTPGALAGLMYNSPCPILFVREGMPPANSGRILVPVRMKDGLKQKLPAVAAWAKAHGAIVCLSAFAADDMPAGKKTRLFYLLEEMANSLRETGVNVETETAHGFHFGTTMINRAKHTRADMIAIAIEPTNFISRLFSKMVGPYFLENASVPVLVVPILSSDTGPVPVNQASSQHPIAIAVAG